MKRWISLHTLAVLGAAIMLAAFGLFLTKQPAVARENDADCTKETVCMENPVSRQQTLAPRYCKDASRGSQRTDALSLREAGWVNCEQSSKPPSVTLPGTEPPVSAPILPAGSQVIYGKYGFGSCGSDSQCFVAGCSAQFCSSDPELITTCEFRDDFPDTSKFRCGCFMQQCEWIRK